jgi:hypothetical protein
LAPLEFINGWNTRCGLEHSFNRIIVMIVSGSLEDDINKRPEFLSAKIGKFIIKPKTIVELVEEIKKQKNTKLIINYVKS